MARRLRFIPPGGALVEITCRTLQGRHLLRPSRRLNELILGVLARAQRLYPLEIHAFVFMSNHYHLLVSAPDARRLAQFMGYLNGNLAREAGRLHRWRGVVWGRRYQAIVVSEEPDAQISRLKYLLSHGCKEGLVQHPAHWKGAHSLRSLLGDAEVKGLWINRTTAHAARLRGEVITEEDHSTLETFVLAPLPCWRDLAPRNRLSNILDLVEQIVHEAKESHRSNHPNRPQVRPSHHQPRQIVRSPAPWFHCASRAARRQLNEAYHSFLAAYRDAADALMRGDPRPGFPEGSFPPPLPYVAVA